MNSKIHYLTAIGTKNFDSATNLHEELETKRYIDASLNKFSEIIRWDESSDLETWSEKTLNELSIYISALQGAFYFRQDNPANNSIMLRFLAGFACPEGIQYLIHEGEGLTGQVLLSKQALCVENSIGFLTYSGLTMVEPKILLILPLCYNNEIEGVIELSSISNFQDKQFEFLKRLCTNIAVILQSLRKQTRLLNQLLQSREEYWELFQEKQKIEKQLEFMQINFKNLQQFGCQHLS